jgi:hypothetical protein
MNSMKLFLESKITISSSTFLIVPLIEFLTN